jgi:predicted DNA-binding transcriptional regulator AlpA
VKDRSGIFLFLNKGTLPMTDDLMTAEQVGELLSVKKATLDNWRSAGKGPKYVKLCGRVKYRAKDVQAFIEAGVRQSTCQAAA